MSHLPIASPSLSKTAVAVGLGAWALGMLLLCATLLGKHLLTLPLPDDQNPALQAAAVSGEWTMLHALSSECRCSRRVLDHLLSTHRPGDVSETILLVGGTEDIPSRAASRGFQLVSVTTVELFARYGIPAVPVLVVSDPSGAIRYTGGYTARKQGPEILDLTLLSSLRSGAPVDAAPLFGCAVNTALAAQVDPLSSL